MLKLTIEVPDVVLVSSLLYHWIYLTRCSTEFIAAFEHVNGGWNTLLP